MCKDWGELAAQIRALREQVATLTAERDALLRQLELADALRNHARGLIVTAPPVDTVEVTFEKRKKPK